MGMTMADDAATVCDNGSGFIELSPQRRKDTEENRNFSTPRLLPSSGVAAMLESSHITHMLRILCFSRLAREQNTRGAK